MLRLYPSPAQDNAKRYYEAKQHVIMNNNNHWNNGIFHYCL